MYSDLKQINNRIFSKAEETFFGFVFCLRLAKNVKSVNLSLFFIKIYKSFIIFLNFCCKSVFTFVKKSVIIYA